MPNDIFHLSLLIVYDVTKRETFTNLADVWVKEVELYATNHNCVKVLVGNKVDKVTSVLRSTCYCSFCPHFILISA